MSQVEDQLPRSLAEILDDFFSGQQVTLASILEEELLVTSFTICPALWVDISEWIAVEVEREGLRTWFTTRSPYIINPFRWITSDQLPVLVTFAVITDQEGNRTYVIR